MKIDCKGTQGRKRMCLDREDIFFIPLFIGFSGYDIPH